MATIKLPRSHPRRWQSASGGNGKAKPGESPQRPGPRRQRAPSRQRPGGQSSGRAHTIKPTYRARHAPHRLSLEASSGIPTPASAAARACPPAPLAPSSRALQRQGQTLSAGHFPKPVEASEVIMAIKQVEDPKHFCRGCGMCEKVCPTNSIHPVQNEHHRFPLVARQGGSPVKRGGRGHDMPLRVAGLHQGRPHQPDDRPLARRGAAHV